MTDSEIRNEQGERIDHTFHPADRTDTLVILGHGLTGNKDRPLLVRIAKGLAAKGWPCLRVSYAGHGASEGTFEDSCLTKEVGDLQAVLEAVPDDVKIAYIGHSMGGAVGVLTSARDLRIQVLVTLAPVTYPEAFAKREFSDVVPGQGLMWDDPQFPLSERFIDDVCEIGNILSAAAAVTQPWLVIHGDADELIPVTDGKDAYAAAVCEKRYLEIPGADHAFGPKDYPVLVDAIDEWLRPVFGA